MKYLISIFVFLIFQSAFAGLLEELRFETEIEEKVNHNLKTTLATQLDPDTFNVAVRVKIQQSKKEEIKKEKNEKDNLLISGLGFADVDVQKIIDSYERELETIKRNKDFSKFDYNITSINILVGISDLYTDEYVATLNDWLKKYAVKNYGTNVVAQVSRMKPAPATPEVKEKEKSIFDYAKDLQTILAALLLALAFLISVLIYRMLEQKKSEAEAQPLPFPQQPLLPETVKDEDIKNEVESLSFQEVDFFTNTLERLRNRIQNITANLGEEFENLLFYWFEQENLGLKKICCLMEAVQSNEIEKAVQEITKERAQEIISLNQEISALSVNERIKIYESVYWDLISYRLVGSYSYRQPFSFLNTSDLDLAEKAILNEENSTKALVIAFMKDNRQTKIISKLSFSEKEKMIEYLFQNKKLDNSKIVDSEATLKLSLAQQKIKGTDKTIDLMPKAKKFIENLETLEQTEILYGFYRKKDKIVEQLKLQVFSLAFFADWNETFAKEVLKAATPEEALVFYSCFPSLETQIFKYLPLRTSTILKDEIQRKTAVTNIEKEERLSSLKEKSLEILNNLGMDLSTIYEKPKDENSQAA
jgi:hypothetical protein